MGRLVVATRETSYQSSSSFVWTGGVAAGVADTTRWICQGSPSSQVFLCAMDRQGQAPSLQVEGVEQKRGRCTAVSKAQAVRASFATGSFSVLWLWPTQVTVNEARLLCERSSSGRRSSQSAVRRSLIVSFFEGRSPRLRRSKWPQQPRRARLCI